MKRLSNRGFTLVELIVVIALVGLLLAITVPLFSTSSSYEMDARERARVFYSNVQEAMVDENIAETELPDPDGTNVICAQVYAANTSKNKNSVAAVYVSMGSFSSGTLDLISDDKYPQFKEFANTLSKLLSDADKDGCYYAVVDSKYRVVYTYFVASLDANTGMKNKDFIREAQINDNKGVASYVGSYPYELSMGASGSIPKFLSKDSLD